MKSDQDLSKESGTEKIAQALKNERDKFTAYIESAPYGIFLVDEAGDYLEVNQAAVEITGYSKQELLQMNILDLHPGDLAQQAKQAFTEIKEENKLEHDLLYATKSGAERWFNIKVIQLADNRFLGFVEDITERKELNKELNMKDKAIKESATAFVFTNQNGKITEVNQSLLEMWDYDREEILGRTPFDLHPAEEFDKVKSSLHYIREEGAWQNELQAVKADGTRFVVYISCTALKDKQGQVQGMMASFIDITERKMTEERLREKRNQLNSNNEELMALNNELTVTKRELTKANKLLLNQIKSAKKLHNQLLTQDFPQIDDCFMSGLYQPAERIGGDFYYAVELDNKIVFYVADITGHSLDGAFLNVFLRETIDNYLAAHHEQEDLSPSIIAEHITLRYQEEGFTADYFISLVLFVLDKESKEIKYTNLGFQIPPLLINDGKVTELSGIGLPVSTAIEISKYEFLEKSLQLVPGDKLIAATDGLIEEKNGTQRYGLQRLKRLLKDNHHLPLELLLKTISCDFQAFLGLTEQQDDVSIIGLERVQMIDKLKINIASDYQFLKQVKEKFIEFLAPYNFEAEMLVMGLHEMLINAIEHGNQGEKSCQVKIDLLLTANYLKLSIKDEGRGFKWQDKIKEGLDQEDFTERGRGIVITNQIWERVCYNCEGSQVILYQKHIK